MELIISILMYLLGGYLISTSFTGNPVRRTVLIVAWLPYLLIVLALAFFEDIKK